MTTVATAPDSSPIEGLQHAALLYRGRAHRDAALGQFVADAAAAGEPVLALLAPGTLESAGAALRDAGATLDARELDGDNPARLFDVLDRWLAAHDGPARVVSESVWPGRRRDEAVECLRHEALLNVAMARRPVSVLCPYDAERLDRELLRGAELTHPMLIDEAGPRASLAFGDQLAAARGEPWPQAEPPGPVSTLAFDGDLAALRRAVAVDPHAAGLDPDRRGELAFAVNEVAGNAVRHGDGRCRVRLWSDDDGVVVEVATDTPIPDPFAGRRRPDPAAADGRGLWLVNQACDLVELRSDATGATLRMHMRPPAPAPARA